MIMGMAYFSRGGVSATDPSKTYLNVSGTFHIYCLHVKD